MTSKNRTRRRASARRAPGAMLPGSLTVAAQITTINGSDATLAIRVGGLIRRTLDTDIRTACQMAEEIGYHSIAYLCGDFVVETGDRTYAPVDSLAEAIDIIWTETTEVCA